MRGETTSNTIPDTGARSSATRTALASIGAIGSVLAASSCCLPILPFLLAAGFAGSSTFLSAARPYLLGASILFIVYGLYQARPCEKMPAAAKPDRLHSFVGSCGFCHHVDLLSTTDGKRLGQFTGPLIP